MDCEEEEIAMSTYVSFGGCTVYTDLDLMMVVILGDRG